MREKIKKLKKYWITLLCMLVVGVLVYHQRPLEYTVREFPMDVSNLQELSCEPLADYGVMPEPFIKEGESVKVTASIGRKSESKTKVAIAIEGDKLRFITSVSVEMGISEPAFWPIVRNDEKKLTAMAIDKGLFGESYSTFILDKKTGFAAWTKNVATELGTSPYVVTIYFI